MVADIETTLKERGEQHGSFKENPLIIQKLKSVLRQGVNWSNLTHDKKEALEMIAFKIGRILSGSLFNTKDSWHDIAGYATLIDRTLIEKKEKEIGRKKDEEKEGSFKKVRIL